MALATFSDLKTSMAAWLFNRTDLVAVIPDFITLAEAEFNRRLDAYVREITAALTITNGVAAVPSGLRQVVALQLTQSPWNRIDLADVDPVAGSAGYASGTPTQYRRSGSSFLFFPPTSATASLRYKAGITPLSDATPTNWVLEQHPDLYLKASLLQAEQYLVNDERIPMWRATVDRIIAEINREQALMHMGRLQVQPSKAVV